VVISIETMLDLNSMSIEEATDHLRAVEERKKELSDGSREGCLLFTEEEWMSHLKVREGESTGSSHGGRGCERGQRGGRGGGRGSHSDY
jgi:hypothetical protein